ncbi:MAG TPA: c-type cytochrome, partial [Planctomycetaceae bacterium]|nr:c-type cytochrome [Planctomycetaceae bacterium]
RSVLTPSGSTYTSREEEFLISDNPDFHPTDVLEDADGSLLVIDTGGWFRIGCPASQIAKPEFHGAIYRIRKTGAHKIDDPRGQKIAWTESTPNHLIDLLEDPRPVVRERAIEELSQRKDYLEGLRSRQDFGTPFSVVQKRNLMWAIQRSESIPAREVIVNFLHDPDESVRTTAIQCLRESSGPLRDELGPLVDRLRNGTPAEKRNSAVTLEHRLLINPQTEQSQAVTKALMEAYETKPLDRHLEHAVTHALIEAGDREVLRNAPTLESPVALRNWLVVTSARNDLDVKKDAVLGALRSGDPLLKDEAFGVLQAHPEWIPELTQELRQLFATIELDEENLDRVRSVVVSMLDRTEIQSAVRDALISEKTPAAVRIALLESLGQVLDSESVKNWIDTIGVNLTHTVPDILQPAFQLVQFDQEGTFDAAVLNHFRVDSFDRETRLTAVRAIAPRLTEIPIDLFSFLITSIEDSENTLFSLRAAETLSLLDGLDNAAQRTLIEHVPRFPAHVLPHLSAFARTSLNAELQSVYLARVFETQSYDRLTTEELQAWREDDRSERVARLLTRIEQARLAANAERKSQLDALATLLEGGIAQKGEQVFQSRRAACAGCHRIDTQGGQIGPDLTRIGRIRTSRDLLEAIVFPSASFARGYEPFAVVNDDGRVYNGVIQSETTHAIVVRTADLKEYRIERNRIDALKESSVSVMPQGIDKLLTPEELRDLIKYLSEQK